MASDYWPCHAHSAFSVLDGMGSVDEMVERVAKLGQPALALTDHGTMAGCLRLYKACTKAGIAPFPGIEAYYVTDVTDEDDKKQRYHIGLLALNYGGFKKLVQLSSRSFTEERFHHKPIIDWTDLLAIAGDDIAVTTGCYFGIVVQTLVRSRDTKRATAVVKSLAAMFPHTFVEVQNHGIYHEGAKLTDGDLSNDLFTIADQCGLPVVLGQDSHYAEPWMQPVHDLMKDICYFGDTDDNRFPGGPYHLASTMALKRLWSPSQWQRIEEGHGALLDLHALRLTAVDKYRFHVPSVSQFPDKRLKQEAELGLTKLGLDVDQRYSGRLRYELGEIKAMGFANYFLIVWDFANFCRRNGILVDARGSANGSLACYALGITTVDPIMWGTDFDRFISRDRKKPPDIDMDIEFERRDEAIDYMRSKFPTMVQIGTYSRIGITETEDGSDKGSVYVQYAAAMRKKHGGYNGVQDEHRPLLEVLAEIPVRRSLGAHAGGFVLPGDGLAIDDYLATARIISSNTTVTQAPMEDVEEAGYVKLDILGLRMLSTLRRTMEAIGKDPVKDGTGWIPPDDPKACAVLRSGQVGNGVFQFEGYSTAMGAKEMKVGNTQEAIHCVTLYRPAVMAGGQKDRYLRARVAKVPEVKPHVAIQRVVDDTWGVPIFQDQVMNLMRAVGLDYDDLNDVLKAIKASNDKIIEYAIGIFERVGPLFVKKAMVNLGVTEQAAEDLWDEVVGFSDYGFNKAHATNYGLRGYRMAYLKAHYPTEFMAATLATWAGDKDHEPKYLKEARRLKMSIGRADVNRSDVLWKAEAPMKLRRGLVSVHGIGTNVAVAIVDERDANGPYKDLDDFCGRLPARPVSGIRDLAKGVLKGTCKELVAAGALKCLGVDPDT